MKKEKFEKPVLCYKDENFIIQTSKQLNEAKTALQNLLNEYQKLNIGECSDLHELLLRPEITCKKVIDSIVELPSTPGKFGLNKEKYKEGLNLPDLSQLIMSAKTAQRTPFAAVEPLFQVVNNEVQLIEEEATSLIQSQNIYLTDERQIKFVKRLTDLVSLWNEVDRDLKGILITPQIRGSLMGKFNITDKGIEINPSVLREWLQDLK
jgi:hypothetical protein